MSFVLLTTIVTFKTIRIFQLTTSCDVVSFKKACGQVISQQICHKTLKWSHELALQFVIQFINESHSGQLLVQCF